jgi:hypothetical protein
MQDITDILARCFYYLYFSFLRFQMQDCPPVWKKHQSDVYNFNIFRMIVSILGLLRFDFSCIYRQIFPEQIFLNASKYF